jgi:hypothetical protein
MNDLAADLIEGYNLRRQTGKADISQIVKIEAAKQIVLDIKKNNLFPHFISLLVELHFHNHTGKLYQVHNIKSIIYDIQKYGYIYDRETRHFIEDPDVRITKNWGVLHENTEYLFAFMRLDIAGNSSLVRSNPSPVVESAYDDLRKIVRGSVIKRNGRIWSWEGDGGLAAFHFDKKNHDAALSAMEIIHTLFMYNRLYNRLDRPLKIRVAIHTGPNIYTDDEKDLKKCDTVKKVTEIGEEYTDENCVTISDTTWISFDHILASQMKKIKISSNKQYCKYELKWHNL